MSRAALIWLGLLLNGAAGVIAVLGLLLGVLDGAGALLLFLAISLAADLPLAYVLNGLPQSCGPESMVGESVTVEGGFESGAGRTRGQVLWRNELWLARWQGREPPQPGTRVRIVGVDGLVLVVAADLAQPERPAKAQAAADRGR